MLKPRTRSISAVNSPCRAARLVSSAPTHTLGRGRRRGDLFQPVDPAALLVDADERQNRGVRSHGRVQLGHLLRRLDVTVEEDDTAGLDLVEQTACLLVDIRARVFR